jgi:hypothetical protein
MVIIHEDVSCCDAAKRLKEAKHHGHDTSKLGRNYGLEKPTNIEKHFALQAGAGTKVECDFRIPITRK